MKKLIWIVVCAATSANLALADGAELLKNGDFATGTLAPWKFWSAKSEPAATAEVKGGAVEIAAEGACAKRFQRQLMQDIALVSGQSYRLAFEARTDDEGGVKITASAARSVNHKKGDYGLREDFTIGPAWKTFEVIFTANTIDSDDPPKLKFNMGDVVTGISLRAITLSKATP